MKHKLIFLTLVLGIIIISGCATQKDVSIENDNPCKSIISLDDIEASCALTSSVEDVKEGRLDFITRENAASKQTMLEEGIAWHCGKGFKGGGGASVSALRVEMEKFDSKENLMNIYTEKENSSMINFKGYTEKVNGIGQSSFYFHFENYISPESPTQTVTSQLSFIRNDNLVMLWEVSTANEKEPLLCSKEGLIALAKKIDDKIK